jgi:hypothetical protein
MRVYRHQLHVCTVCKLPCYRKKNTWLHLQLPREPHEPDPGRKLYEEDDDVG